MNDSNSRQKPQPDDQIDSDSQHSDSMTKSDAMTDHSPLDDEIRPISDAQKHQIKEHDSHPQNDSTIDDDTSSSEHDDAHLKPTQEEIPIISEIRKLSLKANNIKVPTLQEVTRIKDLIVPEELLTQILLQLDNLECGDFSRPIRKKVIQSIQRKLDELDLLKAEFKQTASPEALKLWQL